MVVKFLNQFVSFRVSHWCRESTEINSLSNLFSSQLLKSCESIENCLIYGFSLLLFNWLSNCFDEHKIIDVNRVCNKVQNYVFRCIYPWLLISSVIMWLFVVSYLFLLCRYGVGVVNSQYRECLDPQVKKI